MLICVFAEYSLFHLLHATFERCSFREIALYEAVAATNLLVSLFCWLVARSGRKQDGQADRHTHQVYTFAAHARRVLIMWHQNGFWRAHAIYTLFADFEGRRHAQ